MAKRRRDTPLFDKALLADRLYQLRHRRRWSQKELGENAQVHPVTISKIEQQELPGVSADTIVRLGKALGVSTDFLLGLTNEAEGDIPVLATS